MGVVVFCYQPNIQVNLTDLKNLKYGYFLFGLNKKIEIYKIGFTNLKNFSDNFI